ncbi:hypothetical protein AZI98_07865 [Aeribacillus pallidus]|uniref:Uncharacterized protein n=2 Tax=Aeribacillus pallidus TaxID=33936 RepID=A0A165Y1G9_9BACI|nr:hypothetical protein AZI98_07865 [Aeribacillus pallidus]
MGLGHAAKGQRSTRNLGSDEVQAKFKKVQDKKQVPKLFPMKWNEEKPYAKLFKEGLKRAGLHIKIPLY